MELGPIQEWWLARLEIYPERQGHEKLGTMYSDGEYRACCLGEFLITYRTFKGLPVEDIWQDGDLCDTYDSQALVNTYRNLGLRSHVGLARSPFEVKNDRGNIDLYDSLAHANDDGVSWPEIARVIRENPSNFFTKSV